MAPPSRWNAHPEEHDMPGAKRGKTGKIPPGKKAGKDGDAVFASLKQVLERHAGSLFVKEDKPGNYYLETTSASYKGKRLFFGAVQTKKNYVSFHLMPEYIFPGVRKGMSPDFRKRMRGKSCFNFTTTDQKLFRELSKFTGAGLQKYRAENLL